MKLKRTEIDELLARHGIAPLAVAGTGSEAAARGGTVASIEIAPNEEGVPFLYLTIDSVRAAGRCPLDAPHAASIVHALQTRHLLPHHPSFEHLVAHLLIKLSDLYTDAGIESLTAERVRLHPSAYHIERLTAYRGAPLHLRPRLAHDSHDQHAVFAHRHGDDAKFPG